MEQKNEPMSCTTIRIPAGELERLDAAAQGLGMSRSSYLRYLLKAAGSSSDLEVAVALAAELRETRTALSGCLGALFTTLELAASCDGLPRTLAVDDIIETKVPAISDLLARFASLEAALSEAAAVLRGAAGAGSPDGS